MHMPVGGWLRLPRQSYFWHYLYFLQLTLQPTHSRIITFCCSMQLWLEFTSFLLKELEMQSFQHLVTSAQGQLKPCSVRVCAILTEALSRAGHEHPGPLTSWPAAVCPDVSAEIWGGGNQNAAFPLCSFRDAASGWWLHKLKGYAAVRSVEWTWNKLFIYLATERNCTSPRTPLPASSSSYSQPGRARLVTDLH